MKRVFLTALILALCLAVAAFAEGEEAVKPIWQQGTVFLLQAIGFICTVLILKKCLFGPVSNLLDKRREEIENNYQQSEAARDKAEAEKLEYEKRLAECDVEIREKTAAAARDAQKQAERTIAKAVEEADRRKRMAEDEIDLEKEKAMKEVRRTAVDLGLQVAEKIIKSNLDDQKNRRLAEDFVNRLDKESE